jgi:hypothetical protein
MGWLEQLQSADPATLEALGLQPSTVQQIQPEPMATPVTEPMPVDSGEPEYIESQPVPVTGTAQVDNSNGMLLADSGSTEQDPELMGQLVAQQDANKKPDYRFPQGTEKQVGNNFLKKLFSTGGKTLQDSAEVVPELQAAERAPAQVEVAPAVEVVEEKPPTKQEIDEANRQANIAMMNDYAQADKQDYIDQQLAVLDKQYRDISNQRIDPERVFKGKNKVMMFMGAAIAGAPNYMTNLIESDIAAQKADMENQYRILGERGDLLKLKAAAKQGTPDMRAGYAKVQQYGAALALAEQVATKPGAPKDMQAKINALTQGKQRAIAEYQRAVDAGGVLPDDLVDKDTRISFVNPKSYERFSPGYGLAFDPKAKTKFDELSMSVGPAISGVERLQEIGRKGSKMSPSDYVRAQTELRTLAGSLRLPITGPGALTDDERKFLLDTIGNPQKILSFKPLEMVRLDTIKNKLTKDLDQQAKSTFMNYKSNDVKTFKPSN